MLETLLYSADLANHFLVDVETVQEWFRAGLLLEADNARALSGQRVTTWDHVMRAQGIDPVNLDQASRARLMEPPVTTEELAWLLSSPWKKVTPARARQRMRRAPDSKVKPGFAWFKMPGTKRLYAHRFDVEKKLNRTTDRAAFLKEILEERKRRQ